MVLYLYEFTLLSNTVTDCPTTWNVLYLYEFTLLSNDYLRKRYTHEFYTSMNLHCSQTAENCIFRMPLFYTSMNLHCSQTLEVVSYSVSSFIPLWIYIALKRYLPWTCVRGCFIPLWIYIALKPASDQGNMECSFIPLWIYIALKQRVYRGGRIRVLYLYEFTLLSNVPGGLLLVQLFYTSMNLHCSQT